MKNRTPQHGFTIIEMLTSMFVMGLVLALAVVEFAMVFNHNALMTANMTADQNARISMAKVTNAMRQAMPDMTDSSTGLIVTSPTTGNSASAVSFYRVYNGAGGLVTPVPTNNSGDPVPCYNLVTLSYTPASETITETDTLQTNPNCPTATTTTNVLAYNIVGFTVTAVSPTLLDVDLQTIASKGNYGIYDLNSQVAMGYKP